MMLLPPSLWHIEWRFCQVSQAPFSRHCSPLLPLPSLHYSDFNYQQTTEMRPPIEILPGDSIKTTCIWDSSKRLKVRAVERAVHSLVTARSCSDDVTCACERLLCKVPIGI